MAGFPVTNTCYVDRHDEGIRTGCQEKDQRLTYRISITNGVPSRVVLIAPSSPRDRSFEKHALLFA